MNPFLRERNSNHFFVVEAELCLASKACHDSKSFPSNFILEVNPHSPRRIDKIELAVFEKRRWRHDRACPKSALQS